MKILMTIILLTQATAFASTNSQKICDSLYDKAIYNCEVIMCEDWLKNEDTPITKKNIDKCLNSGDGDLREGAQICAVDGGEFEALIKAFNVKNPKNKINCEDN